MIAIASGPHAARRGERTSVRPGLPQMSRCIEGPCDHDPIRQDDQGARTRCTDHGTRWNRHRAGTDQHELRPTRFLTDRIDHGIRYRPRPDGQRRRVDHGAICEHEFTHAQQLERGGHVRYVPRRGARALRPGVGIIAARCGRAESTTSHEDQDENAHRSSMVNEKLVVRSSSTVRSAKHTGAFSLLPDEPVHLFRQVVAVTIKSVIEPTDERVELVARMAAQAKRSLPQTS